MKRFASVLFICLIVVTSARPAGAGPTDGELRRAEALATEARAFFKGGVFRDAASKFMEAFALSKRPSLVYNAARAYEEAKALNKARALFKLYLSLGSVDASGQKAAETHLKSIEATLDKRKLAEELAARRRAALKAKREAAALKAKREADARRAKRDKARRAERRLTANKLQPSVTAVQTPTRTLSLPWTASAAGCALVSLTAYGLAYHYATKMPLSDVNDVGSADDYRANRTLRGVWQGVSIGAAVASVGLAGWTAWTWWRSGDAVVSTKTNEARWAPIVGFGDVGVAVRW